MSKQKKISGFTRAITLCNIGIKAIVKNNQKDAICLLLAAISEIAGELEKQRDEKRNNSI